MPSQKRLEASEVALGTALDGAKADLVLGYQVYEEVVADVETHRFADFLGDGTLVSSVYL